MLAWIVCIACALPDAAAASSLSRIAVSADGRGFVEVGSGAPFRPLGFNYDHDGKGHLLEDYWVGHWDEVVRDLEAMRRAGANVIRVHLQFVRFMRDATEPDGAALTRLRALFRLAERLGLRLDVTGLGAYRRSDQPAWYDGLDEKERWDAQALFWRAVADVGSESPAIFCYDLMNEPVVPPHRVEPPNWLPGRPFGGFQYVQYVTLEPAGRPPVEIAKAWVQRMADAVRGADPGALVTVGLAPWSLDRLGQLESGFVPDRVAPLLDFTAVHIYPRRGKNAEALATLRGFLVGKPLLVEEIFPLYASVEQMQRFRAQADKEVAGWIGFFRPFPWPPPQPPAPPRLISEPAAGMLSGAIPAISTGRGGRR